MTILVVIRGNSGSGKTTVAREVRSRYGRGCALIEQDQERRIVLREHDIASMDPVAPHYIADSVRSALRHGYHVVLEGILHADRYGAVLRQLIAEHPGPTHVVYLDVPLEETLRRHQDRAASVGFTADDMRGWYTEHDVLGVDGEQVIDDTANFEDTVTTILSASGLADAAPLAPCPVRCPHCAAKGSSATPHLASAQPAMPGSAAPITVAALAIVPAGDGRLVFIRQQRGPYAGSLLLPGGKVDAGETFEDAARREAFEEAGVRIGALSPCGVYDMSERTAAGGGYRFLMFAFLERV